MLIKLSAIVSVPPSEPTPVETAKRSINTSSVLNTVMYCSVAPLVIASAVRPAVTFSANVKVIGSSIAVVVTLVNASPDKIPIVVVSATVLKRIADDELMLKALLFGSVNPVA